MSVLILRPQPGAERTRERAAAKGLDPVVAPLFVVEPVMWNPPDPAAVAAVAMTSANAARHAGLALGRFTHLPLYAVGAATAAAARAAGFDRIVTGAGDVAALAALIAAGGAGPVLHLAGEDHRPLAVDGLVAIVYRAAPVAMLPHEAFGAARRGAVALLHSPRAAGVFRTLAEGTGLAVVDLRIAAISPAAAVAAGPGWRTVAIADRPSDDALLAAAARLCDQGTGRGA